MTSVNFSYNKPKVIQALRLHFISRKEIKWLMIVVNLFAILSATLFYFKKISPWAFLLSSLLWFLMMILFWFLLPKMVYKKSATFKDSFKATIDSNQFMIENNLGNRSWTWAACSGWMESPFYFHIYFNNRSFFLIPKDAFPGDEEHQVRKIISGKLKRS